MSKTDVYFAGIVKEALAAVESGIAEVASLASPEFFDISSFDRADAMVMRVKHQVTIEWTEYLNE